MWQQPDFRKSAILNRDLYYRLQQNIYIRELQLNSMNGSESKRKFEDINELKRKSLLISGQ